jgi:hypothetical protein
MEQRAFNWIIFAIAADYEKDNFIIYLVLIEKKCNDRHKKVHLPGKFMIQWVTQCSSPI